MTVDAMKTIAVATVAAEGNALGCSVAGTRGLAGNPKGSATTTSESNSNLEVSAGDVVECHCDFTTTKSTVSRDTGSGLCSTITTSCASNSLDDDDDAYCHNGRRDVDLIVPNGNLDDSADTVEGTEVFSIDVECPQCAGAAVNRMQPLEIPGFRQCFIMVFLCPSCGARSSEVKSLGAYGPGGRRWVLRVEHPEDLNRDVLKSDTASVVIPELDLELCTGTLGGVFTTVEGLIVKIADQLDSTTHVSTEAEAESQELPIRKFVQKLRAITFDPEAQPFHVILDDPADLSGISRRPRRGHPDDDATHNVEEVAFGDSGSELLAQARVDPKAPPTSEPLGGPSDVGTRRADEQLVVESYARTAEQDDDLGLNDLNTDGCIVTPF